MKTKNIILVGLALLGGYVLWKKFNPPPPAGVNANLYALYQEYMNSNYIPGVINQPLSLNFEQWKERYEQQGTFWRKAQAG